MEWLARAVPMVVAGCTLVTPFGELTKGGAKEGGVDANADAADDGACGNVLTDSANCGRCGHDCLGAACQSGMCAPVVLASSLAGASGIAVDASNVYFTLYFGPQVAKCALSGCGVSPTVLASSESGPNDIKLDATTLYWASEGAGQNGGSIRKCTFATCASTKTLIANGTVTEWVAIDATRVYWTSALDGLVRSCPLAGCGGTPTNVATGQTVPWSIAVDQTSVYFSVWNGSIGAPAQNGGAIRKCPLAGCSGAPITLASAENQPWQIALDAQYVYWTGFKDGTVKRCAVSGCNNAPTIIASGEPGPSGIAVDATNVYWTNYTSGTVRACAKEGCSVRSTVVATGQNHPNNIVLDDAFIYFTDFGTAMMGANDGSVVKVAK